MRAIVWRYVKQVMDDDVAGISAELAYRAMFATLPFAIFLVALSGFVASWLGIADPSTRIINTIGRDLPADVVGPVKRQLDTALAHTHPELLSIGALVTFYAAASGANTLMKAMNRAFGLRETRPLVLRSILAGVLTTAGSLAVVFAVVVVVGGTLMTRQIVNETGMSGVWPWLSLLRWPVSFALLVAAVAALLRFAPAVRTPWRWSALAAMVFALAWLAATYVFGIYVARFASYDATYGYLAGVIVLMLWFYLSAFVLVCAAELAASLVRFHSPEIPAQSD